MWNKHANTHTSMEAARAAQAGKKMLIEVRPLFFFFASVFFFLFHVPPNLDTDDVLYIWD